MTSIADLAPEARPETEESSEPAKPARRAKPVHAREGVDWEVRRSAIHGSGAFCLRRIEPGAQVAVYEGALITEEQAEALYGDGGGHTFLFARSDGLVIDGGQGGNGSRFINHGCEPNVEASESRGRMLLRAIRAIEPGEELLLDYRLQAEGEDAELANPCRCGAPSCRGTLVWRERHAS